MQLTIPISECQHAVRLPAGALNWSEEEFFQFCQVNRDLRIERTAKGEIIVMSPAGGYSGYRLMKKCCGALSKGGASAPPSSAPQHFQ